MVNVQLLYADLIWKQFSDTFLALESLSPVFCPPSILSISQKNGIWLLDIYVQASAVCVYDCTKIVSFVYASKGINCTVYRHDCTKIVWLHDP